MLAIACRRDRVDRAVPAGDGVTMYRPALSARCVVGESTAIARSDDLHPCDARAGRSCTRESDRVGRLATSFATAPHKIPHLAAAYR